MIPLLDCRVLRLALAFAFLGLSLRAEEPFAARFHPGDDPRWADPGWNDRDWASARAASSDGAARPAGTFWLRVSHAIAAGEGLPPKLLFAGIDGEAEVFWDGRALDPVSLGSGADRSSIHRVFAVNEAETRPGSHVLALRFRGSGEGRGGLRYFALSDGETDFVVAHQWRMRAGDAPEWAAVELDDSSWARPAPEGSFFMPGNFAEVPAGIFWLRTGFIVSRTQKPQTSKLLFAILLGASEIHWDGHVIARNGIPGDSRATEKPGLKFSWIPVPDALATPGYHQLAIRMSSNHPKPVYQPLVTVLASADNPQFIDTLIGLVWPDSFALGFVSVIGVLYLLLFAVAGRRPPHLLLGLTCIGFSVATMLEMSVLHRMFSYTYDLDRPVIGAALALTMLTTLLFPAFLLAQFRMRRPWIWLAVAAVLYAATAAASLNLLSGEAIAIECLVLGAVIAGVARWQRKPGSTLVLVGISLCIAISVLGMPESTGFGFLVLVCCLLGSLSFSMREQQERHQRTLLTKARLETQLLKHSIQPHFLMNTLNALVDWVEENPRKGVELIHAIGRHFDLLLRIAGETTIAIGDEIQLCESYLTIMSYREEVGFTLEVIGVAPAERLPPCVIHTLAENGITHNRYRSATTFRLVREPTPRGRRYRFECPVESGLQSSPENRSRGTGSAYIEARLEEAYPDHWRMQQTVVAGSWVTTIEIEVD